jgi:hypothetical protein
MGFFDATTIDKDKKEEEEEDEKCGTKEFSKLFMAPRIVGWLFFCNCNSIRRRRKIKIK